MTQQRKQSHDHEKYRPCRIDNDAGCDLRSRICGRGRIVRPGLARSDRPLGPATATRLQCFLSGDGDADGRNQCAPLSWRTEIERLTSSSLQCCRTDIPGKRAGRTSVSRAVLNGSVLRGDEPMTTFLSTSVQRTLTVAAVACKVCAWCVTKTLTKSSREMAVIAKPGCVRNLSESLTCTKRRLAL
jgi:hypothetical protein